MTIFLGGPSSKKQARKAVAKVMVAASHSTLHVQAYKVKWQGRFQRVGSHLIECSYTREGTIYNKP